MPTLPTPVPSALAWQVEALAKAICAANLERRMRLLIAEGTAAPSSEPAIKAYISVQVGRDWPKFMAEARAAWDEMRKWKN